MIKKNTPLLLMFFITQSQLIGNFPTMSKREQVTFRWDDNVRIVPDQHAKLGFCSASSLKQHSRGRRVAPHSILIQNKRSTTTGVAWGQILPRQMGLGSHRHLKQCNTFFRFKTSSYGIFEINNRTNLILHYPWAWRNLLNKKTNETPNFCPCFFYWKNCLCCLNWSYATD